MSCQCPPNVRVGSHLNTVAVPIPPHMESYREARIAAGLTGTVGIDRCILQEIRALWAAGIRTYGSCCGHNHSSSMVNVHEDDAARMDALGYVRHPLGDFSVPTFFLKSAGGNTMNLHTPSESTGTMNSEGPLVDPPSFTEDEIRAEAEYAVNSFRFRLGAMLRFLLTENNRLRDAIASGDRSALEASLVYGIRADRAQSFSDDLLEDVTAALMHVYVQRFPQSGASFVGCRCAACDWTQPDFGQIDGHNPRCLRCGAGMPVSTRVLVSTLEDDPPELANLKDENKRLRAQRSVIAGLKKCRKCGGWKCPNSNTCRNENCPPKKKDTK